jgi:hypothetical protein
MSDRLTEGLRDLIRNAEEAGLPPTWQNLESAARALAEKMGEKVSDYALIGAFNVARREVESQ